MDSHVFQQPAAATALPSSPAYNGENSNEPIVYKLVLTGGKTCFLPITEMSVKHFEVVECLIPPGPCAGKTTAWKKLRALFEDNGWKVCVSSKQLSGCVKWLSHPFVAH